MVSIRKNELLTTGLFGIIMLARGIIEIYCENKIISIVSAFMALVYFIWMSIFIFRANVESLDEFAKLNYGKACITTLIVFAEICTISTLLFYILDFSILLNSNTISIILGCILIFNAAAFIYYDTIG